MSVPLRKRRIRLTAMSRSSWEMNMLKDLIHIKCRVGWVSSIGDHHPVGSKIPIQLKTSWNWGRAGLAYRHVSLGKKVRSSLREKESWGSIFRMVRKPVHKTKICSTFQHYKFIPFTKQRLLEGLKLKFRACPWDECLTSFLKGLDES